MCSVKAPKVEQPKDKAPTVIRNPYLDGVSPEIRASRKGRNSLRIARGSTASPGPPAGILPPRAQPPGYMPVAGGGGRGGALRIGRSLNVYR